MRKRAVVAALDSSVDGGGERAVDAAGWSTDHGLDADVLFLHDGDRLGSVRSRVRTTVVDEFRRRGLAGRIVGAAARRNARAGRLAKAAMLRRWLLTHRRATWLIVHPDASAVFSFLPRALWPRRVWWVVDPSRWSTSTAFPTARAVDVGRFVTLDDLPDVTSARPATIAAPVVVVIAATPLWTAIDHSVEFAWQLDRQYSPPAERGPSGREPTPPEPATPRPLVRIMVGTAEDRWLVAHDIDSCQWIGDAPTVVLTEPADATTRAPFDARRPHPFADADVVVRAAPGTGGRDLLDVAASNRLAVVSTARPDVVGSDAVPLDVESLVARTVDLLDDGDARAAIAARQHEDRSWRRRYDGIQQLEAILLDDRPRGASTSTHGRADP